MPRFDGTGPDGRGPLTGAGEGFCAVREGGIAPAGVIAGLAGASGRPIQRDPMRQEEEVATMPRGDRTGPAGMGPMTGRAAGYCAGYGVPGYLNPAAGWQAPYYPGAASYAAPLPYGPAAYGPVPLGYAPYPGRVPFGRGGARGFGRGLGRGFGRGFGRGRGRW